jgi:hypothetical protein
MSHVTVISLGAFVFAAMVAPVMAFQPPKVDVGGGIHIVMPTPGQPRPGQPGPDPAFSIRRSDTLRTGSALNTRGRHNHETGVHGTTAGNDPNWHAVQTPGPRDAGLPGGK